MSQPHFDWTLVRSFLAVLEAGSLMGAARRLGMHQPTLSRHVAQLEAQLGTPLFERTGRGLHPTAAARGIADAARQMELGAQALAAGLARGRESERGTVRITTSDVAAVHLLPPVLAELQHQAPGIQLELVASNLLTNLLSREADIAVRMVRPAQASLLARKVADIGLGIYAHTHYLARAGAPRQPEDLLKHRLIGFDQDPTVLQGFARMGMPMTREQFALRTDDQVAYGELVRAGAGIGFLAHYVAGRDAALVRVLPGLRLPTLPCWLAVHREIRASRVVRTVFDHLARAIPLLLRTLEAAPSQTAADDGA